MNNPVWIDDKGKIVEPEYCRDFLTRHPMRCINERFYTVDGPLPDESKLKRTIYEEISPWLHAKVAQTVEQVIKALKLAAYADPLPLHCDRIHVANGTYFLDGTFTEEKEYCGNRLSVSYRADAPAPQHWLRFLSELLEPEDIPALQEYLGYCLIPSTKGQKMLMLIGKGGEGKSRIGVVMNAIFGLNMNTTSIQKVENNRFARADLEGKLLMIDDDLDMNALTKTNYVKSIVTAELRMDLERKKEQSYQGLLYVRFLCFGNGALTALHDRSDGFFRRQIILTTKDKPADRFDDPFLAEKLIAEKEGIFLWMLEGLRRLIANHYHSTISQRARTISLPLFGMPITFWTFSILRVMWHSRPIMNPAPKICTQPISGGVRTTQKTHCPQRALQTSLARTQNATIWNRSAICTSAAENGAGGIWAFMFCSRLWSCNETSKPSVRAFMRS